MSKINTTELFHHFANRVAKSENHGMYSYRNDTLFYGTHCITKILSVKKKVVIIDKEFNRVGSFGNGYAYWDIEHSFSKDWTILYGKPNEYDKCNTKTIYKYILSTALPIVESYAQKYIIERELVKNSRAFTGNYYSLGSLEKIKELFVKFNINSKKFYKHIYNTVYSCPIRYHGWRKPEYDSVKLDKPISFWLDETKWFDESERRIIEFKNWKNKNATHIEKRGIFRYKTYKEIWANEELRINFEELVKDTLAHKALEQQERERKMNESRILENKMQLEEWFNGKSTTLWYIPIELRLSVKAKIASMPDGVFKIPADILEYEVETTKGARVPLHHAERLFKFFKKCIAENKVYIAPVGKHTDSVDTIGVYHLKEINKNETGWFILAGCHTIYKDAIDRFIERYKLNWNAKSN